MSNTVDNRLVEMGFDNKQFESGVKTSTDSLNGLKKALNLDESAKSLTNLSNVSRSFSLAGISEGVQNISSKFSALGVIGLTVIQNLTNAAINFGKKLVSSITAPMKTGLAEFETQINAIQTVLANTASKGTTLEQVNAALDKLNEYSDKTIYNFSEMTKNIGTFTAAGIDLDTSVSAIKGIANLAAVSGSNSQQASTAMYQLSQALSTGTVRLMDWNSVVNAGMGGQVFQDALKESARVHGIAIDDIIKKEGSFRESLSTGWLSSQILTETLAKFTGDLTADQLKMIGYTEDQIKAILELGKVANDAATKVKTLSQLKQTLQEAIQSGWSQSWRLIIGDFDQSKRLFTEISDTLGALIQTSSDARNAFLKDWQEHGGRTYLIQALRNAFEGLMSILAPIKEALTEIFPPMTGQQLANLTFALRELTAKLKIGGETADKVKRIFKGVFAGLDILKELVFALAKNFLKLISPLASSGDGVLNFLVKIADYIVNLREAIKINDVFGETIKKVSDFLLKTKQSISNFAQEFKKNFDIVREWLSGLFKNVDTSGVSTFFDKLQIRFEPLKALGKVLAVVLGGMVKLLQKIAPTLFKLASGIGKFIYDLGSSIFEGIANLDFSKLFDTINTGLLGALILAIRNFVTKGSGALDGVTSIFTGVSGILDGVRGSLEAWQQNLKAKTLLTIAGAIAILTASLVILSAIDSKKLTVSLAAITAMFAQLMGSMALYSKISGPTGGIGFAASIVALSVAVLIMSAAVVNLAKLDSKELERGLLGIGALAVGIVAFTKIMSKNVGSIMKGSGSLILFAFALEILVDVVKKLGSINVATLTNGLIAIGVLLSELAIFMRLTSVGGMGVGQGLGLLALAGSLLLISDVVEKLGSMDVNKIKQGLVAIGIIFTELAIFVNLTGDSKKVISTAIGMTILGAAMVIFANVISQLGNLSWEEIARGLAAMGGALLIVFGAMTLFPKNMIITGLGLVIVASALVILANALNSMGSMSWDQIAKGLATLGGALTILTIGLYAMQGSLAGAAAMLIVATAIAILAPALKMLGSMSLQEIGLGLLALAAVFTVLGIAGAVLTPVVPTLLGLAGAILLLGIAITAIGAGVLLFSMGMAALAVSGAAGAIAIVAIITTIIGLVPLILKALGDTLKLLLQIIIDLAPILGKALKTVMLTLIDVIIEVTPPLLKALEVLLLKLIDTVIKVVPKFIDAVLLLVGALLKSLADSVPEFVQSGIDIILGFLKGIRDNIGEIVTVAIDIVTNFLDAVADKIPDVIDSGFNLIISFINGLADSIEQNGPALNAAIGNLANAIVQGLCDGLTAGVGGVISAIGKLAGAAIDALKTLLGIFSPSTVFEDMGEDTGLGFIKGILNLSNKVSSASSNLGKKAISGMNDAIGRISDTLNNNLDLNPTIRPVVDLTDIISGREQIDNVFGKKSIEMALSINKAASVATGMTPSKNINIEEKDIATQPALSFTQYNYSPKALSRIEIYRLTKNQLIIAKGLV